MAVAGPDLVTLRTPVELVGRNLHTYASFTVAEGDRVPFVLTWSPSHETPPEPIEPEMALEDTVSFWEEWSERCAGVHPWDDAVRRSLITLKALTYAPTGGIVAAPTTSLPEALGGVRNWDYRFCWLRDATLTLLAFIRAGYTEEAEAWRDWLLRAIAGSPDDVQVMYGVAGERRLVELELPWLAGYEASRPVRIGNGAAGQLQIDVYGEVIDALYHARRQGVPASDDAWALARKTLDWLESGWKEPDEGVWEVRGPQRHFTHSKIMSWVAFDRAVKTAMRLDREGPVDRWRASRREIREAILTEGFDTELNSFVQYFGSDRLDASLLLIPLVGFLPADDPRVLGTVAAIERDLMRDGLVERYRADEDERRRRRAAAGGGRLPPLLVLARRGLGSAGTRRRGSRAVRAAALAPERPRPALGGVRPRAPAARRQLPAGVHPPHARGDGLHPFEEAPARRVSTSGPLEDGDDVVCRRRARQAPGTRRSRARDRRSSQVLVPDREKVRRG